MRRVLLERLVDRRLLRRERALVDHRAQGLADAGGESAQLKRRLEAEGLFEDGRKRPLPAFPRARATVAERV